MAVAPVYQNDDGSLTVDPSQAVPSDGNGNPVTPAADDADLDIDPVAAQAAQDQYAASETDAQAQSDEDYAAAEVNSIQQGTPDPYPQAQAAQAAQSPTQPIVAPTPRQPVRNQANQSPVARAQAQADDTLAKAQQLAQQSNQAQAAREAAAHQTQVNISKGQAPASSPGARAPQIAINSPGAKREAPKQNVQANSHKAVLLGVGLGFLGLGLGAVFFGSKK